MTTRTEFPKDLKFANLKDICGMVAHIISRGYIDSLGIICGERKSSAYIPVFVIQDKTFIKYFANTLLDFDLLYEFIKMAGTKSNISCEFNTTNELMKLVTTVTDEDGNQSNKYYNIIRAKTTDASVTFDGYDNPHIFKTHSDNLFTQIDPQIFANAIINDYIYTDGEYVITREAVPKPKKLEGCMYAISDNVKNDDGSYIYFTTKLIYPLIHISIASACYDVSE